MKFLAWMLILCLGQSAFAQERSFELKRAEKESIFKNASELFVQGKYQDTILELSAIESRVTDRTKLGLIAYWKGIAFNRLQEYSESIIQFDKSLGYNYAPADLHYEYGQALYAAEKLSEARIQFRESLKRKFKRGISLYYIGYISKEMGDLKKAFTFFKAIERLTDEEALEVRQAAEMQIGDLYLEQVEKRTDVFSSVENYVLPQYKKALELNKESTLAPLIREKILTLQRRYDLILFQLRNGRPTLNPPHLLRLTQEVGQDSNVTFSPAETTISESKQASLYSKTNFIGRYTFYYRDFLSITPEFRFNNTYYFNRVPEIYRNDNYLLTPALRTAFEHSLWDKPAATLFDYEYGYARRDINAQKKLEFNSRSHTLMIGERFNFWDSGETIVRLRHRILESYVGQSDFQTTSLVFEQIKSFKATTLLFYLSYDRMRVKTNIFDTDSLTFRTDLILPRIGNWFTPMIGMAVTSTDPINARASRGRELLLNPSARISKSFKKHWRANLKYEYQKNDSKDKASFAYKKSIYGLELEYLF